MVEIKDLIDIASVKEEGLKEEKTSSPLHPNIKKFINDNEIESGEVTIPTYLLFYVYKKLWQPDGVKINKIQFFREFNKVFKAKRTGRQRYYKLNNVGIHLKEEAKKHYDQYYKK